VYNPWRREEAARVSERIPMTKPGYDRLQDELKRLKAEERPAIVREIETARAHGDLSENAEYHAAKDRQGHVEARIRHLEDKLARAQVIEPSGQPTDKVRFGLTVDLEDADTGERVTYTILGEDEADVANGTISVRSPVARALLGKQAGDFVTVQIPKGTREFQILEIRNQ
jgi:transcription elongation factor GreA